MPTPMQPHQVLQRLADGRWHSGASLASDLGLSRTAVWKHVRRIEQEYQVSIDAVRGKGYRLASPLELLSADEITSRLSDKSRNRLRKVSVLDSTPSTNSCALAMPPSHAGVAFAWFAEHQTAGRGRRGRTWVSAFGRGVALSLAWRFDLPLSRVAPLSLVAGVAVAEAIEDLGISGHFLKWPNDVMARGRKLAGILVEAAGEADGPTTAVIGVGVNVDLPSSVGRSIDQPWIDLAGLAGGQVSRNATAAAILDRMIEACASFALGGLPAFRDQWAKFDGLSGEYVCIDNGATQVTGTYSGIADDGALILRTDRGTQHYHAGEISLRRGTPP